MNDSRVGDFRKDIPYTPCDHLWIGDTNKQKCCRCGASCTSEAGKIVEYESGEALPKQLERKQKGDHR